MNRTKRIHILLLSILIGITLITADITQKRVSAKSSSDTYGTLSIFTEVLKNVQDHYVEDVKIEELIMGAIRGMLSTLDPHSAYLTPEQFKEMQVETTGRFGGLGIEIAIKDGILTIVAPIEGTPAERAGLKAGDRILEIDGQPTKPMTIQEAVSKLRGPKGTKVTITIMREEWTEPKKITIVRDIIKVVSVKSKMLEDGYGYLRITQFNESTSNDLHTALNGLEQNGLKGLILDLRNNPGGLLDQAVKVSDEFIDSGLIVYTEGRMEGQKMRFEATKGEEKADYPIVVIVNAGSASASEIVAGALQDHGKALIIGTPTFGKGSVQTIFRLQEGAGLRLTTAKYFTPKGRSIQGNGIIPDIMVEEGTIEVGKTRKKFREIDLERHMGMEVPSQEEFKPIEDLQLRKALELLKTWNVFSKGKEFPPSAGTQ